MTNATDSATVYNFSYSDQNAGLAPDAGTLAEAIELSADLDVTITLYAENGEERGWVHPNGQWRLT